jgi:hypothetical protein
VSARGFVAAGVADSDGLGSMAWYIASRRSKGKGRGLVNPAARMAEDECEFIADLRAGFEIFVPLRGFLVCFLVVCEILSR